MRIDFRQLNRGMPWALCLGFLQCLALVGGEPLRYNQQIRPILSDNCFFCHGPDQNQRKGKLRLDIREDALAKEAFVPGKPDESELIKRIFTEDQDDLMPPPESHKKLSAEQKEMLRRWVAEGAVYEGHWAYQRPVRPETPPEENGVDYLVRRRLKTLGLTPAPEADRRTLARRLYFDLVGLPPTAAEVEAFEKDSSPDAYEKLVGKLLASPHYGERMAIGWLDVVRFADTIGYHSDNPRNVWPYRDYVIRAFNQNKPFDQFTREQIAGDLLPNGGLEQKVASAFNRLLLSTEEGGAQPKDYESRMLTDRVRAIGTVWLGQTIGCAQCHDHKFDPITMRDFYSMGAFFADIKEPIIGRREDGILVPSDSEAAELARLESNQKKLQSQYDGPHPELTERLPRWEKEQLEALALDRLWRALTPAKAESKGGAKLETQSDKSILVKGRSPDKDTYTLTIDQQVNGAAFLRLEALPDGSLASGGPGRSGNGNFVLTEVVARITGGRDQVVAFKSVRASHEQTSLADKNPYRAWNAASVIDGDAHGESFGWAILPETGRAHQLVFELATPLSLNKDESLVLQLKQNHADKHTLGRFRISAGETAELAQAPLRSAPPKEIAQLLAVHPNERDKEQAEKVIAYHKGVAPELAGLRKDLAEARKSKEEFEGKLPRCLVSTVAEKPRTVRILPRGNWMDESGEVMKPALPGYLTKDRQQAQGEREEKKETKKEGELTRLDLADWLVSPENPLTARVFVNRLWKQFFGVGLSKILDDLGSQGEPPPNQELLDWLASEFVKSKWDIKQMVRLMVTSQTYRQASTPSRELMARDPANRELATQSRWRLEAELVRDNALVISGLIAHRIGGPSVRPYQPDGYWENLNFPPRTYEASKGGDQYRRGLYTWWQRSFLHPSMVAFDAPTREECAAERIRSNIPQQALVLLNDPTYVEAARVFAERIVRDGGSTPEARIDWAWRQALQRPPRPEEFKIIQELVTKHLAAYQQDSKAAEELLKTGLKPLPEKVDPSELAAWTSAARVILNLHETITRS